MDKRLTGEGEMANRGMHQMHGIWRAAARSRSRSPYPPSDTARAVGGAYRRESCCSCGMVVPPHAHLHSEPSVARRTGGEAVRGVATFAAAGRGFPGRWTRHDTNRHEDMRRLHSTCPTHQSDDASVDHLGGSDMLGHAARATDQRELASTVAEYNLSDSQAQHLAEHFQARAAKVERGMQQRGMKTLIEACEHPGENSLEDTIAGALWRLESSRALSDSITGETQRV